MNFKPTEEQEDIFFYVKDRPENVIIQALAGCGKTTTIVEAIKLLPKNKSILFLAFNKHIQNELKERLPEGVYCYTFHGLGVGAIKRKYGDSIQFDEFKVDHIIKKLSKRWKMDHEFASPSDKMLYLSSIKQLVNLCRQMLVTKPKYIQNVAEKYDIELASPKDIKRVRSVMEQLVNDRKTYDFTDMIFLPAIDPKIFLFQHDYVFVDEIQDLNNAQQRMLELCLKRDKVSKKITGRLIGVGDRNQSIYGFTGVSEKSFDWFLNLPKTKILPLTYTFRCAKDVVKKANEIVPDLKALDTAEKGIVRAGDVLAEAEDGDFILSRTTRPLIALFFKFLIQGKKAVIKGMDFGLSLIELIEGHKTISQLIAHHKNELAKYREELRKRGILDPQEHTGYVNYEDKVMVLDFLGKLSNNVTDMKNKIKLIFTDDLHGIVLSTVHKAKGLEADRVFIVRPDKLPMQVKKAWQFRQEKNLEYVAITRAKTELVYDYEWTDEEDE